VFGTKSLNCVQLVCLMPYKKKPAVKRAEKVFVLKTFFVCAIQCWRRNEHFCMQPLHHGGARAWFYYQNAVEQQENSMMKLSLALVSCRRGICGIDFNSTLIITGEGWKSTLGVWARARERERENCATDSCVSRRYTLSLSLFLSRQSKANAQNKMREEQKRVGGSGVSQSRVSLLVRLSKALLRALGARKRFKEQPANLSSISEKRCWKKNPSTRDC
jgi:hypothetical protein